MNEISNKHQYEKVVRIIFVYFSNTPFTATDIRNVAKIPPATAHAQIVRLWYEGLIVKDSHISEYHYRTTPKLIIICVAFLLDWVPREPENRIAICDQIKNHGSLHFNCKVLHFMGLIAQQANE